MTERELNDPEFIRKFESRFDRMMFILFILSLMLALLSETC